MTETERRLSVRHDFIGPVCVERGFPEVTDPDSDHGEAAGVDVSRGGLGLLSDQPLEKGSVVRLILPAGTEEPVAPVLAEVVWVSPAADRYRIGLRFLA